MKRRVCIEIEQASPTARSADFQSAVSQVSNLQSAATQRALGSPKRSFDAVVCRLKSGDKSAQQVAGTCRGRMLADFQSALLGPVLIAALLLSCLSAVASPGSLGIIADHQPQRVFGGENRRISVLFTNGSTEPVTTDLSTRLYQSGGAIAARWGDAPWKEFKILPGQTVLEEARISFPQTRGETLFLVQWIADGTRVIGVTEVLVYPTNLLDQLKPVAAGEPVGLLDPCNRLKPAMSLAKLDCVDLSTNGLERFHGKLAIVDFAETDSVQKAKLASEIKSAAERGVVLVWIQPALDPRNAVLRPSICFPQGEGAVAMVAAESIDALAENPVAQLHLAGVARMAARPDFWMAANLWE